MLAAGREAGRLAAAPCGPHFVPMGKLNPSNPGVFRDPEASGTLGKRGSKSRSLLRRGRQRARTSARATIATATLTSANIRTGLHVSYPHESVHCVLSTLFKPLHRHQVK